MNQRVRELVDDHIDAGDLDAVVERVSVYLDAERIDISGTALMNAVVDAILDKFEGRLDTIPTPLLENLMDYGHITRAGDAGQAAMIERLTIEEKTIAEALNSKLSAVQRNALIVGLQNGTSPITARVLAVLSWYGLEAFNMILDEAASRLMETKTISGDANASTYEDAYEAQWEAALFFPDDPDEFELDDEEEKSERRDTESLILDRVNFLKSENAPTVKRKSKGP